MTRGAAEMLASHSSRVALVPPYADGTPAVDVDITLHDSLADLASGPVDRLRLPPSYGGALVAWTWNPQPRMVELALAHGARGCLAKSLPAPASWPRWRRCTAARSWSSTACGGGAAPTGRRGRC